MADPTRSSLGVAQRRRVPWGDARDRARRAEAPALNVRALAIDLGSATTQVFVPGRGVVLDEPSVVAVNERSGDVLAMGRDAWRRIDEAPGEIVPVRPLRHGVVTDYEVTERMLRLVLDRVGGGRWGGPRVLITVSSVVTPVERRAVSEAALSAGARGVELIPEPMAAAIGAALPIDEPTGSFILDIGGGTTEAAIISLGGMVSCRAERVGGFDLDDAVRRFLRDRYDVAVGERTAENLKMELGSASPGADEPQAEIRGRDIATGTPKTIVLTAAELRAALDECVGTMIDAARGALALAPPELAHDVLERGLTLAGGGALLRGLDARISDETTIPVHVAPDAATTVVQGAGRALGALDRLKEHGILLS